jgi:hypothetical protein
MREAGHGPAGLSQVRRPIRRDLFPDLGLGEAGIEEGEPGTPTGGCLLSGTVVAHVVERDAEQHRRPFGVGHRPDGIHERFLAMEATIGVVGPVGGRGHLFGLDRGPAQAPLVCRGGSGLPFGCDERGRHGRDGPGLIRAERLVGDAGEERRVDSPEKATTTLPRDSRSARRRSSGVTPA